MSFLYFLNKFPIFPSKIIWFSELYLHSILLKLPFILADIGISYLLYLIIKNKKIALTLVSLFLFTPALIYNSAVWGQTDSLLNLFFLTCLYFYLQKKYNLSIFFLITCFLFKMSLFIFIPIMFFYFILISHWHSKTCFVLKSLKTKPKESKEKQLPGYFYLKLKL